MQPHRLLVMLRGQVALDIHAQTSVDSRGRLVTTFPAVNGHPTQTIVTRTLTIRPRR